MEVSGNEHPVFSNADDRFTWLSQQPIVPITPKISFFTGIKRSYSDLWKHRDLLGLLTRRELKARYKDSALGYIWTLIRPLINLLIYYVAIGKILGAQRAIPDFAIYVFAGLTAWTLFSMVISTATTSVTANSGIVKKVYLPRELFPLTALGTSIVDFVSQLVILVLGALLIAGIDISSFIVYVPLSFAIIVVWGLGIGLVLSALNVYFRDTQYLVEVILMIGFWLAPTVYSFDMISSWAPQWVIDIYLLNPSALAVMGFQKGVWIAGNTAHWAPNLFPHLVIMLIAGIVVLFISQRVFALMQRNFAQEM